MAKKEKVPSAKELEERILSCYKRWKQIYDEGCSDPSWEDGVNINLVRNHIIYHKKECDKYLGNRFYLYPDCYFFPLPPELPNSFMAKDRYLNCKGEVYRQTKDKPYDALYS